MWSSHDDSVRNKIHPNTSTKPKKMPCYASSHRHLTWEFVVHKFTFYKKIASDGDFMNGEWVRQFMLSASCMFLEIIIFYIPCIHSWASLLHESKFINTHTHILWRDFRIFWLLSFFVYEMRLHFFGILNLRAERTFSLLEEF